MGRTGADAVSALPRPESAMVSPFFLKAESQLLLVSGGFAGRPLSGQPGLTASARRLG